MRRFFAEHCEIVVKVANTTLVHKLDKNGALFNVGGGNKFAMSPVDVCSSLFPPSRDK
ncbi:MAG: hypothetical protein V4559_15330 [Pseudomonadota bacterium]